MWYPLNTVYSTENFSSPNTGDYVYTDFSSQNNIGGYVGLRNIVTGTILVPPGEPWPPISWTGVYNFSNRWLVNSGSFISSGSIIENPAYGTISFTGYSSIELPNQFSFANGYVIEGGVYISRLTGNITGSDNSYGFIIQDNGVGAAATTDIIKVRNNPLPGFVINQGVLGGESFIPATGIGNNLVNFRFGRRGNLAHFITSEGYSAIITGSSTSTRLLPTGGITIGNLSTYLGGLVTDQANRIEVSHLYFKSNVGDIAGDFIDDTRYSQTTQTVTTSPYYVSSIINNFNKAYVYLVGETGGGLTTINAYVSNSSFTGYNNIGSFTADGGTQPGLYSFNISSYTGSRDLSDNIKFTISQKSSGGLIPPLSVEYITITMDPSYDNGLCYLHPKVGSSDGEYPVIISIDPKSKSHISKGIPSEEILKTFFYLPLNSGEGFQVGSIYRHIDSVSKFTGTTSTTSLSGSYPLISGFFDGNVKNFRDLRTVSNIVTELFTTGANSKPVNKINYNTVKAGHYGELIASTGYSVSFPSSTGGGVPNYTGAATISGYSLNACKAPNRIIPANVPIRYTVASTLYSDAVNGSPSYYLSQDYAGCEGFGFELPYLTGSNFSSPYIAVEAIVQVNRGAMGIYITGSSGWATTNSVSNCSIYPYQSFNNKQRVRSIFDKKAGQFKVGFIGIPETLVNSTSGTSICDFSVSNVRVSEYYNSPVLFTGMSCPGWLDQLHFGNNYTNGGVAISAWCHPDGWHTGDLSTGNSIFYSQDTNGVSWKLGINKAGKPTFSYFDPADLVGMSITGTNSMACNRWNHLLAQVVTSYGGLSTPRVELYLNGVLTNYVSFPGYGLLGDPISVTVSSQIGNAYIGAIEEVKVLSGSMHPDHIKTFKAFQYPPKFQSSYQFNTGNALALYRFDRGSIVDYSTGRIHAIVPDDTGSVLYTERNVEGVFGEGILFGGRNSFAITPEQIPYVGNSLTYAGYMSISSDSNSTPRVFEIGGTKLHMLSGGYLRYTYSGITFTGTTNFSNNFGYFPFVITHNQVGTTTLITGKTILTGNYSLGTTEFTGYVAGYSNIRLNDYLCLGHAPGLDADYGDIYLDEFLISSRMFTGLSYAYFRSNKEDPVEPVYVNNNQLDTGRIRHIGVYEKEIVIPPRASYTQTGGLLSFRVRTLAGDLKVTPAFTYLGNRYIIPSPKSKERLEELANNICKTKSPFRIGRRVPQDAINLAFITTPELSIDNNLSLLDASDSVQDNIVGALSSYFVTPPVSYSSSMASYTGVINTDDINITSYVIIDSGSNVISPLFFAHRLGNDRYLYKHNQISTGYITYKDIRNSIKIFDDQNNSVDKTIFPWDIRVSSYNSNGDLLPSGTFSVDLLSRDRFIPDKTLFIEYSATDLLNGYNTITNFREVINPEPIYRRVGPLSHVTGETFSTTDSNPFSNLNTGRFNQGPILNIYPRSGQWGPFIHSEYITDDDFII